MGLEDWGAFGNDAPFGTRVLLDFICSFVGLKQSGHWVGLEDSGVLGDDEVGTEGDWDGPHEDGDCLADDRGWSEVRGGATGVENEEHALKEGIEGLGLEDDGGGSVGDTDGLEETDAGLGSDGLEENGGCDVLYFNLEDASSVPSINLLTYSDSIDTAPLLFVVELLVGKFG